MASTIKHPKEPIIGLWYKDLDSDTIFEVVAIDKTENSIEIQYFDGNIAELDWEVWLKMEIREIPQPEDWSGPYELDKEDGIYQANEGHSSSPKSIDDIDINDL